MSVHHLHLWSVASDETALSAHLVMAGAPSLHEAQAAGDRLKHVLEDQYGVTHSTLELECHPCPAPTGGCGPAAADSRPQDPAPSAQQQLVSPECEPGGEAPRSRRGVLDG